MAETTSNSAAGQARRELILTRILGAPRSLVFRAWTDPKHMARWWGPRGFTTTTQREFAAEKHGAIEGGKQTLERLAESVGSGSVKN